MSSLLQSYYTYILGMMTICSLYKGPSNRVIMQAAESENPDGLPSQTEIMHADSDKNEAAMMVAKGNDDGNTNQDPATGKAGLSSQTETITYMDSDIYNAATIGEINIFRMHKKGLDHLLTPYKNTVLHIYITALSGKAESTDFVEALIDMCPSILHQVNVKEETPLHIAARYGHAAIVKVLIERAKAQHEDLESGVGAAKQMLRLVNNEKDTALHEAVRNGHLSVVKILTKEDPDFTYSANAADETPLYLAAEKGFRDLVFEILVTCTSPAYGGPNSRTAMHAAVICNDGEITRMLLETKWALTKEIDSQGWTPLHYAAYFGHVSIAYQLLKSDISTAYYADKVRKMTPIHVAARRGYKDTMKQIMNICPDCCELVDKRGRNIFHLAVQSKIEGAVKLVLENSSFNNLLNQKDVDGNTPLHLLAASLAYIPSLIEHPRLDKLAFNKRNLTALDVILADDKFHRMKRHIEKDLEKAGSKSGWRNVVYNDDLWVQVGESEETIKDMKKAKDSQLIVAALIATVTFTVGFTVPGGFINENSPDQGTALLKRNPAFSAFIIFDTVAMVLSSSAVFIHLFIDPSIDKTRLYWFVLSAFYVTMLAMAAMILAFITGTYAVLAPSWLAIATCVIGLFFFSSFISNRRKLLAWILKLARVQSWSGLA